MLEKSSILAVVVTYHPDNALPKLVERLQGQVGRVLVVDNHSDTSECQMLRDTAARLDMDLILNTENLGVATALNLGASHAMANGFKWLLLFDQDSVPSEEMFEGLQEAYDDFPRREQLAIIGSNYITPSTGNLRFPKSAAYGRSWIERRVVITSGSLLSLRAYETMGPFRDEYFIDCVDLEYCLRARSRGFEVIATARPLMSHGIGRPTPHRLPWRPAVASNHSRIRRYYMIRNQIDLTKRYFLREPVSVTASLWARFRSLVSLCLFEDDRRAKMTYSWMGLVDGLRSNFERRFS